MTVEVWCHTPDPSAFYRLLEPARVLGVRVVERAEHVTADTVVTNRPILAWIADQIEKWRREGRRVIVDVDDAFDWLPANHGIAGKFTTEPLHRACRAASVVTCSTFALIGLYSHGHGVVVRNCVPEATIGQQRVGRGERQPWVGWVGSLAAHPNDLQQCGDGVARALRATDAAFAFVGPETDAHRVTATLAWNPPAPDFVTLGTVSLRTLPSVLVEFDAGIVPLEPSRFNAAKSWLKGLEYSAAGVPAVASPTPEYRAMAGLDGCLLASRPGQWFDQLHRLLTDPVFHAERVAAGLDMARQWTYETRARDWGDTWGA
ncbi:glycosyltransferase [Amycolatopsis sp. NPDC006131]|uniref:glycosyltransferase n=1 Tax=Amycolatopsis sp. NPDC006131 TaxID=3156731 RepID=UPI0033BC00BF